MNFNFLSVYLHQELYLKIVVFLGVMLCGLVDLFLEEPAASIFRMKELYIHWRWRQKVPTVCQATWHCIPEDHSVHIRYS
jgi:hypothetical protein